jgi:hypothetical protein
MSKIYFSRSISRTLSADQPVGDPTGGVAYGEKNDPVSAIISIATMGGTYAAAGSFAAMTVMQGITFAGAALSLAGNVTGNKTLSKIGMVAGIAGGIGSLAESAGIISRTPTLGETFGSTGGSGTAAGAMSSKSALSQSQAQSAGNLTDEIAAQTKITDANMAARGGYVSGGAGQAANSYAGAQGGAVTTPANVNASAGLPNSGSAYTGAYTPPSTAIATSDALAKTATDPNIFSKAWEATKGAGSAVMDFTKAYPEGAMMIGATAQPVADYLSGKTDAEIAALEAQTGYADANALRIQEDIAREKRRRENLNAGYAQVNTGINVNPAVLGQAQAGGLISGAMQPAA